MASDAGLLDHLGELALQAAREAASLIEQMRRAGVRVAATKSSASDIVTEADRASEELVRRIVLTRRPHDSFRGEEGDDIVGSSGVRWIVDPVDGTVNYAHGVPQYAVSIAAEVDGVVEVGVVLNAATGRCYRAIRGRGAFRDDEPIAVAVPRDWPTALVGTGFSYDRDRRQRQAGLVATLLPEIGDVRRLGSCALDLCAVADGSLDGYVEDHIGGAWDYAAGALIASEAGARVVTSVADGTLVIAAPAGAFEDFLALLRRCGFTAQESAEDGNN